MSHYSLPVRRPVATAMFFLGVLVVGVIAWRRIPVELLPPVAGAELFVSFDRPGSEPEAVEREILLPLESRVRTLPDVEETWADVSGASGTYRVRFRSGTKLGVRELELRRLAADLARTQPMGTRIDVSGQDLSTLSRFVMFVQVTGMDDRSSLLDFVEQRIVPRLGAVEGVAQVLAGGGAPQELSVTLDPDRCAALGVTPEQALGALTRAVRRLRFLGRVDSEEGRASVILDGRPRGAVSLGETRVAAGRAVLLRHVAVVELRGGREEMRFRVNGEATVGMVLFQEEGTNLVRLGRALRERLDALEDEFAPYGIGFVVNFDAAELVEEQLDRLKSLAFSGFVVSLLVLYLFLRQWRAVAVVAVSVPMSLLAALALLFLGGYSLNLITLFGLAVGIGMLVDNSIVVYEATQRQLEHGATPDAAAETGTRRTLRAILASTVTSGVVFLPIAFVEFEQAFTRALLEVMSVAIMLPMAASLLVAVGLVPLLARWLAAPAALARIAELRRRREAAGGLVAPERARVLFRGLLVAALRRPGVWVTAIVASVLLTVVVALPLVAVSSLSREAPEENPVRISVELPPGGSIEHAVGVFERLEQAALEIEGVEYVESVVREASGSLTVHLPERDERPRDLDASRVRGAVRSAAVEVPGVDVMASQGGFGGGGGRRGGGGGGGGVASLLGQGPASVVVSGSDARTLDVLAHDLAEQIESIPEVERATVEATTGLEELRVTPDATALAAFGLTADQVLPALSIVRREGVPLRVGFALPDGREIPLVIHREPGQKRAQEDLRALRLATPAGTLPLGALADVRRMPPPPAILHHDGRREISVAYTLGADAPATGAGRTALDEQIGDAVQELYRPAGYTIETPGADEAFDWFRRILVPILLLLFAVLAVTFESLTLPLLVLVALPITVLGATWALVLTGTPGLDPMVLMGVVTLIGLTVNPAILLVDRMQQRVRGGAPSPGAAALAAVDERARPILMSMATAVAGLWPLALVTGQANEIWPPFATVVMGGLVTSTLLTLLAVPVGFVFLRRLDRLFGRLGPWVLIGWVAATAAVMAPLIAGGVIDSLTWQVLTTLLVGTALLGVAVLAFQRPGVPEPATDGGPPEVEVRFLRKTYGEPGPVGRAWRSPQRFAERVLARGARAFDPAAARARIVPLLLVCAGFLYLVLAVRTVFWRLVFLFVAAALVARALRELRRARGRADVLGRVHPGGVEGVLAAALPWVAWGWAAWTLYAQPQLADERAEVRAWVLGALAVGLAVVQLGRWTAVRVARGAVPERLVDGRLRRARTLWRRTCRQVFGLDLPREQVRALARVHFVARRGMVGILGPNGAGKTTLLRILAGILEPSVGTVTIGGVLLARLRRHLARWVGYLPQDFGLPADLSAREYLDYYALLYEIGPAAERRARVESLLAEVGLAERAGEKIGSYSGGMRQRVAVARTLLRLPAVIIVDEPTVGLDPRERIRFRNLLARLAEGRVVLFSTHVVEDVAVACERVIVFARGEMVFDGPPPLLAREAEGCVWEARLDPVLALELPPGALVVDQAPEADGRVRSRILCSARPHAAAEPVAPTLEDGYLRLVGVEARA